MYKVVELCRKITNFKIIRKWDCEEYKAMTKKVKENQKKRSIRRKREKQTQQTRQ
jgi:transketolase C-terminal domain/subunit